MRRRDFIVLGGAAAAWPQHASAQSPLPVAGFLNGAASASLNHLFESFRRGLAQNGLVEGRNVVVEAHWANGDSAQLPAMAAELVRRQVAVIVAGGPDAVRAAKAATSTIPIAFSSGEDPVRAGFVASLARPGGNVTGIAFLADDLAAKRFELARELVPNADLFAVLANRTSEGAIQTKNTQAAAQLKGKRLLALEAAMPDEINTAFEIAAERKVGALLLAADPFFLAQYARIVALAAKLAMPVVTWDRYFTTGGCLGSYGADTVDVYRLVGVQTARILKGEKPADLPVQQPVKFEMAINLKTARAFGLDIPPLVLASADEVIE